MECLSEVKGIRFKRIYISKLCVRVQLYSIPGSVITCHYFKHINGQEILSDLLSVLSWCYASKTKNTVPYVWFVCTVHILFRLEFYISCFYNCSYFGWIIFLFGWNIIMQHEDIMPKHLPFWTKIWGDIQKECFSVFAGRFIKIYWLLGKQNVMYTKEIINFKYFLQAE